MSEENIKVKIDALLQDLHEKTGVSDVEIDEFKKIMELSDFSQDQDWYLSNGMNVVLTRCEVGPNNQYQRVKQCIYNSNLKSGKYQTIEMPPKMNKLVKKFLV